MTKLNVMQGKPHACNTIPFKLHLTLQHSLACKIQRNWFT